MPSAVIKNKKNIKGFSKKDKILLKTSMIKLAKNEIKEWQKFLNHLLKQ